MEFGDWRRSNVGESMKILTVSSFSTCVNFGEPGLILTTCNCMRTMPLHSLANCWYNTMPSAQAYNQCACVYKAISWCVSDYAIISRSTCTYHWTLYGQAANALIMQFLIIHNSICCLDNQSSACQLKLLNSPFHIYTPGGPLPVVRQLVKCPWKITLLMEFSTCRTLWKSQNLTLHCKHTYYVA